MKLYLAADHAGFELKEKVKTFLEGKDYEVKDCGAETFDPNDDYPDFIKKAAKEVSNDPDNSKAVIFGGSGQAEAMVANKYPGVRCAIFYAALPPFGAADFTGRKSNDQMEMIRLTREHNDANVLSIGARFITEQTAKIAIEQWLQTNFNNEERHVRRINKIKEIEDHG